MPAARLPDRDEYPEPNLVHLRLAIEAAYEDRNGEHPWSHHVRGRYTAHRTYTELNPDSRPGDKIVVIRVEECERDVIADIPEEQAESVLDLLDHRLAGAEPHSLGGDE